MNRQEEISFIESELKIRLPKSYKDFLFNKGNGIAFGLPILGLPATYDLSTALGATALLRLSRPELQDFLAVRIYDNRMLCLDLSSVSQFDAPLVEINLNTSDTPQNLHKSFGEYLKNSEDSKREIKYGLERLKNIIARNKNSGREYNHTDNNVPFKARHWRVHRCCVHDLVVGLTAFRYNESFNGIEVDTFLSTEHPDYEKGHGTKALIALILADAYKNGTSMEVRFREKIIPKNLLSVLKSFDIKLQNQNEGIISHSESISIFSSLLGIQSDTKEIIQTLEKAKEATLQGVCFLINSRVWTTEEVNWLIINAPRVKAIIFGRDNPENRINYSESLSLGRCALALTKFKEKVQISSEDETNELEIKIANQLFVVSSFKSCSVDWLKDNLIYSIKTGETFNILSRPRSNWINIAEQIQSDINVIETQKGKKIILYSNDILSYPDFHSIFQAANKHPDLSYLIVPFSSEELDEEIIMKIKKARRYRA